MIVAYSAVIMMLSGVVTVPLAIAFFGARFHRHKLVVLGLPLGGLLLLGLVFPNFVDIASWSGRVVYGLMFLATAFFALCGLFLASQIGARSRAASLASQVLRVWLIVGSGALMIEIAFRIFPAYDSLAVNPGVRFFWPDWVSYRLNNFGHRDRDFVASKPATTYRILLLGDSFTEGAGLDRAETFGRIAEAFLNERSSNGLRVELYNLGHAGMNTREEAEVLLRDGPKLSPDLVVLNYVWNDAETHPLVKPYIATTSFVAFMHTLFLDRLGSYAYYWFYKHFTLSKTNFPSAAAFYQSQYEESSAGWRASEAALDKMKAWLKARNVPCIVFVWPFFQDDWPQIAASLPTDRVFLALKRNGFHVIDLLPGFRQAGSNLSDFALSTIDSHPNAEANRIVAHKLAQLVLGEDSFVRFQQHRAMSSDR